MRKYWIHIAALVISLFIGGVTALHLGQDLNYDLLNYHYYNPYAFLEGRVEHNIAVGGLVSYENPLRDVPGYLLIDNLSPKKASVALGIIQGLNIWILFEIGLLLFGQLKVKKVLRFVVAFGIAALSFFGAASISEVGSTMGDNMSSIFIFGGLWLLLYSLGKPAVRINPRWIRLAAFFLAGAGMGLKLTNVMYGVALLLTGLLIEGSARQKIKESFLHAAGLLAGILSTAGFWYFKTWVLFKNPIFPFYNAIFESEYYPGRNFVDERWTATSAWQGLTEPFQYFVTQAISVEQPFRDPRITIACSAILVLLLYLAGRRWLFKQWPKLANWSHLHTAFLVFFGVSYITWSLQFSYYRYALPIELLSLIAIAVVAYGIIRRFWPATFILVAAITFLTWWTTPINWGRIPWQPSYFGVKSSDFVHLGDSTVLMGGYAPLSFLVPYFPDSTQTIRVQSDLSSPAMGTPKMQAAIRDAIEKRRNEGSKFFAMRTDEDAVRAESAFNDFGFRTARCREIPTHMRAGLPQKYRLCELTEL